MIVVALLLAVLSCQNRQLAAEALVLNVTNIDLIDFYTTISFGGTTYTLKIDTGVNFITLPSLTQTTCHTTNRFTCGASCSKGLTAVTKEYMPGLSMTGNIASDDFVLGTKAITDMKFLLTTSEVGFESYSCDGMLGLNIASFFDTENSGLMYDLINQEIVPLKQVGMYLSATINDTTSQLTLGGFDTTKAVNMKWLPVSSDEYWTVATTGYKIGTTKKLQNDTVLFSTGLLYTYVPTDVFLEYTTAIKKKYSTCDYYMDSKLFGCVVKDLNDTKGFPELRILAGEEEIILGRNELVFSLKIDNFYVAVALMKQVDDKVWMLGTSYMGGKYMVFNAENKTIGISGAENKITLGLLLIMLLLL